MSAHRVEKSGFRLRTPAKKRERWRRKGAAEEQEEKNDPNSLEILLHRQPRLISPLRRWLIKRSIRCTPLGASKYNFSGNPLSPSGDHTHEFRFPISPIVVFYALWTEGVREYRWNTKPILRCGGIESSFHLLPTSPLFFSGWTAADSGYPIFGGRNFHD